MVIGVRPTWLLCSISLLAAACSGSTIHEIENLGRDKTLVTSTDVRVINRIPVRAVGNGRVIPESVSCAEPSPDVAKAVSESFNLSGSFETGFAGQGLSPNVAAALVNARSEAIAQLTQRLATIQLLRDGLYRACEAYANGAINSTTYAVILSRFDDTMVTMLMGELAAGNFGGRMAGLGTAAGGNASAQLISSYQELIEAALSEDAAPQPEGMPPDEETTQPTGQAPSGNNRSLDRQSSLQAIASGLTETSRVIAAENLNTRQDPDVARVIGTMQRKYLENINFDAMVVACINALDSAGVETHDMIPVYTAYRQASEDFKQDPNNLMKRMARDSAEKAYKEALLDNGKMSPLGWHCLGDVMPEIAANGFELLKAVIDRANRSREPEEAAAQLKRYADALFGLRHSVEVDQLRLDNAATELESLTERLKGAQTMTRSARVLVEQQRLVVTEQEAANAEARDNLLRARLKEDIVDSRLLAHKADYDAKESRYQSDQKKADALAADGAEGASAAAETAQQSKKQRDEAKEAFDAATEEKGVAEKERESAQLKVESVETELAVAKARLEELLAGLVEAQAELRIAQSRLNQL